MAIRVNKGRRVVSAFHVGSVVADVLPLAATAAAACGAGMLALFVCVVSKNLIWCPVRPRRAVRVAVQIFNVRCAVVAVSVVEIAVVPALHACSVVGAFWQSIHLPVPPERLGGGCAGRCSSGGGGGGDDGCGGCRGSGDENGILFNVTLAVRPVAVPHSQVGIQLRWAPSILRLWVHGTRGVGSLVEHKRELARRSGGNTNLPQRLFRDWGYRPRPAPLRAISRVVKAPCLLLLVGPEGELAALIAFVSTKLARAWTFGVQFSSARGCSKQCQYMYLSRWYD